MPLLVIMSVAIAFWRFAHQARTDWSMLLGSLFLLTVGAGPWSVDARLATPE